MRSKRRFPALPAGLFLAILVAYAQCAGAAEPPLASPQPPPVADPRSLGPVAAVGHVRIGAEEVLELWSPVWYETLAKVRNGKMSAADGDAKLTAEWRRIITALVKDELFFQEAEREHASFINMIVDNYVRAGADRSRNQIASEVRRLLQQDIERFFRQFTAEMVKESGGMVKLHKVLEGRGLSFQEWQNRLRKKAFTQSYLHQIIKPRAPDPGPKQIQEYYSGNTEEFAKPGLVRFRHIYFSNAKRGADQARDDAVAVWERLVDGEIDFETAARENSDDDVSKAHGGLESGEEAGDPEREAWLADIRTALREEKPGEIAPILESPFGCHIAVLISIGPDTKVPFNEVRREIERKLTNEVWEAETDRYFLSIKKNTEIKVLMSNFPPYLSCESQIGRDARSAQVFQISKPEIVAPKSGRQGGRK